FILIFFFFFQAEDGIRDRNVTGVRRVLFRSINVLRSASATRASVNPRLNCVCTDSMSCSVLCPLVISWLIWFSCSSVVSLASTRSEERRVGKECRSRWEEGREEKKESEDRRD